MFSNSPSGTFARATQKGSRAFIVLGIVAILVNFSLIFHMFLQRPVYSEEAEIVSGATSKARESMTVEWIAADAKFNKQASKPIVMERKQLFSLYRLRVLVVATEAEVPQLPRLLNSLVAANYSGRCFPVDVEVHILGNVAGLPPIAWEHGRYDVYAHRLHGNANPSIPFVLMDLWQPQSNFELGVPLTANAVLTCHWFQWVMRVVRQYASASKDDFFHLETSTSDGRLRSPLSQSLNGIALGPPVAGTGGNAAAAVLSAVPSTTMVFTAEYWRTLLAQAGTGVDVDDVAAASWRSFLGAAAASLSRQTPKILFPPLGTSGALACDTAGVSDAMACSIMEALTPAALEALLRLPVTVDLLPKMQGQEK